MASFRFMYVRHKFGARSSLRPNEVLFHERHTLRVVTLKCAVNRSYFERPLTPTHLFITDCRLFISATCIPFWRQEIVLWFSGRQPEGETELITKVTQEKSRFLGRCVEVRSLNPTRPRSFFAAPELIMRFYCNDPEALETEIRGAMSRRA